MTQHEKGSTEMGKQGKKDAIREHREARAELERISRRDREETDAYLAANRRVIDAEKNVSAARRFFTR